MRITVLASDVSNSAVGYADVTGLSFEVVSGNVYYFKFFIRTTAGVTTTGAAWSINGPATTYLHFQVHYPTSTATNDIVYLDAMSAYNTPGTANTASPLLGTVIIEGLIKPSANGTVIARFSPEVAAIITAKEGSIVHYQQVA